MRLPGVFPPDGLVLIQDLGEMPLCPRDRRRSFASAAHIRCLLPQPVAVFSVSCADLAVQGIVLGKAAVLHFAVFADIATGAVMHSKSLEVPSVSRLRSGFSAS